MSKHSYKVYADIRINPPPFLKRIAVQDTGAGQSCIGISELCSEDLRQVATKELPEVRDANWNPVKMAGTRQLLVRLGLPVEQVEIIVCEVLAAPVVLGFEYCGRFIEAIGTRAR